MIQPHFQRLGEAFRLQAARSKSGVVDQLQEIRRMAADGQLTPTQANAAIDQLLGIGH